LAVAAHLLCCDGVVGVVFSHQHVGYLCIVGELWNGSVELVTYNSAHACSSIGQKWLLLFVLWDLGAVSCAAIASGLFAVSALLKPAQMPYAAERYCHNRYRGV
jgi:hypothetical protein